MPFEDGAPCLQLELWEEALEDAEAARRLAENSLKRNPKLLPGFVKALARKGAALVGEVLIHHSPYRCAPIVVHVEMEGSFACMQPTPHAQAMK